MPEAEGNWSEWKNLVLSELKRLSTSIENLGTQLGDINTEIAAKADEVEVQELRTDVESAHRKINYFSGIFTVIGAGITSFLGLKG